MAHSRATLNSGLTGRLAGWLVALETALEPSPHATSFFLQAQLNLSLTALSPLKRAKSASPTSAQDTEANAKTAYCWQLLLHLLLLRGWELSLTTTGLPTLASLSTYTALSEWWQATDQLLATDVILLPASNWDETALLQVVRAIGSLATSALTAEFLTTLPSQTGLAGPGLRKRIGAYYTPLYLAGDIVAKTLAPLNFTANFPNVVDPACGSGIFLVAVLDFLVQTGGVPVATALAHIYGLDLNPQARDLAVVSLLLRGRELGGQSLASEIWQVVAGHLKVGNGIIGNCTVTNPNLTQATQTAALVALPIFNSPEDGVQLQKLAPFHWQTAWPEIFASASDIESSQVGFDAVVGNPPYVGFNDYSGIEKAYFAHAYPQVYNLKNDLLYYFIKRGVELLKTGGRLGFVTSSFWLAAVWAARLRGWLATATSMSEIQNLSAPNLFSGANVPVCLLFLTKQLPAADHHFLTKSFDLEQPQLIGQKQLGTAPWVWLHRSDKLNHLLQKINGHSLPLGHVAECRTGVQTGYDRAFFVSGERAQSEALECGLLRRAIKNSDISFHLWAAAHIAWADLYLLYPPPALSIADYEQNYPALTRYLAAHQTHLDTRRRYSREFPYQQLQWPRARSVFEAQRKLVTPYKAPRNTFALDTDSLFFSTDVISVVFKRSSPLLADKLEVFAANFLCSQLATFQFRSYSKLVGGAQYDYYANPVKQLAFPTQAFEPLAGPPTREAALMLKLVEPELSVAERDRLVYALYDLNEAEIALLEAHLL